jgi:F-type H+-transporting ATPase subunit c
MKKMMIVAVALMAFSPALGFAEEGAKAADGLLGLGAGLAIGFAVIGAAFGLGKTASAALESIGRNPSASGQLFLPMILGLALIEALGILGFVIANSIVGKL